MDIVIFIDDFSKLEILAPDVKLVQAPLVQTWLFLSFSYDLLSTVGITKDVTII